MTDQPQSQTKSIFQSQQKVGMVVFLAFALITITRAQSGYSLFSAPENKDWRYLYYAEKINELVSLSEADATQIEITKRFYFSLASEKFEPVMKFIQEHAFGLLMIAMFVLTLRLTVFSSGKNNLSTVTLTHLAVFLISCVWISSLLRLRTIAVACIYAVHDRFQGKVSLIESITEGIEHQQFRWMILLTLSCGLMIGWLTYLHLGSASRFASDAEKR